MASALVGGAFLSGFINVVFDRLFSPEAVDLIRNKKLDQHLVQRLQIALSAAGALVIDAEMKQFHDDNVNTWLDSLKNAVYDANDLFDLILTKAATQKKKEVSNFLSPFRNYFKDKKMVTDLEEIVSTIEDIAKHKDIHNLKVTLKKNLSWKTPSTSIMNVEMKIRGREDDKEELIKLLKAETTEATINVIPIVGMGGVGKTTLAQWLYNNDDLMKEFDLKVWICVSEEFDVVKMTQTIIEAITHGPCNMKDLNLLQHDLKDKLMGKKFFIVLDDVWSDDRESWKNFRKPFQFGVKGSNILVTTRNKGVASVVQSCPPYLLNELTDEYCWSVFKDNACYNESSGNSTLEEIGRKIVKKCKGLPLAAETLGGLLQTEHDTRNWNAILESDIWEFSSTKSKIVPALLISYYHLPPYLKCCFAYCSLFPKDYRFNKDELILLWMAEDLLEQPKRGKTFEKVGYEYFDDLASRLFFKQFSTDEESFVMHDLMHDLAISVAGKFYFRLEELGNVDEMSMMTRHLSYERLSHPISKNFDAISRIKSVRTLLPINFSTPEFSIENTINIMLSNLKCLRILSFVSFKELDVLPDSICELIHLRYLNLSETKMRTLPESLCDLYNLQTLKLSECEALTMLPNGMQNLVNLRHLDIRGTNLKEMPRGMSKLEKLHILSHFVVGKHEENGIMELGELSNLHGSLQISKLENVAKSSEALKARIMDKTHIDELCLKWSMGGDMVPSSKSERDILDKLKPHKGLQVLRIERYKGTTVPDWVGHSSYHNMTRVSLTSCSNCCMLPSLGQLPSLKSLEIANFDGLVIIGDDFYRNNDNDLSSLEAPFPSLEDLLISKLSCWEVWQSSEPYAFPKLKRLRIYDCPTLTGNLPSHLPALETLDIENCGQLISSLPKALAIRNLRISKSDKVLLQEIPLSLESITIKGCELVKSMFQATSISHLTCLQFLWIEDCSQITDSCHSLPSFPPVSFPNLMYLTLCSCENLASLLMSQSQFAALYSLQIDYFPNLVSFPREGLNAPIMNSFHVSNCEKLKSLPCHMNTLFPKLELLRINNCPEIELFPDEGLPPSLKALQISSSEKLLSNLSSMGAHESLTYLYIWGPCESKSFPKEFLMPQLPSLSTLSLHIFSNMETLDCKELIHLTSLQELIIYRCPKLKNMTGDRLPSSLIKLQIDGCPLLAELCKTKHPNIWPKISHIRGIQIDERWVT